eukprot:9492699-Pyramimonas_sp.AAC.1
MRRSSPSSSRRSTRPGHFARVSGQAGQAGQGGPRLELGGGEGDKRTAQHPQHRYTPQAHKHTERERKKEKKGGSGR